VGALDRPTYRRTCNVLWPDLTGDLPIQILHQAARNRTLRPAASPYFSFMQYSPTTSFCPWAFPGCA
jgi:hypothetical protein